MEKKDMDWGNIGFAYHTTDQRYVADFKDGQWQEGYMTGDATLVLNECAGILQYCQEVFEGLKAYTTADGSLYFPAGFKAGTYEGFAKRWRCRHFQRKDSLRLLKKLYRQMRHGCLLTEAVPHCI